MYLKTHLPLLICAWHHTTVSFFDCQLLCFFFLFLLVISKLGYFSCPFSSSFDLSNHPLESWQITVQQVFDLSKMSSFKFTYILKNIANFSRLHFYQENGTCLNRKTTVLTIKKVFFSYNLRRKLLQFHVQNSCRLNYKDFSNHRPLPKQNLFIQQITDGQIFFN